MSGINEKLLIVSNATVSKRSKVKVLHIREIFRILSLAIQFLRETRQKLIYP